MFFLFILTICTIIPALCSVDVTVFSYNRPLQLEAFIRSLYTHVTDTGQIHVIYRADDAYKSAYQKIMKLYPHIIYLEQSSTAYRGDFKPLTCKAVFDSPSKYVLFAVDDIIITRKISLNQCIHALESTQAYAFYLRLGKNITECYMLHQYTGLPVLEKVTDTIFKWQFASGQGDWKYPHTVDLTIYRKQDIKEAFMRIPYHDPNALEGLWALEGDYTKTGLCFEHSVMVNTPLNLVRTYEASADYLDHEKVKNYTPDKLLEKFNAGYILNIEPLYLINNKAPHIEYIPTFIRAEL
jgi:hypothetical protein